MNASTLSALAEPNRMQIVELLKDRPLSVNDIAARLETRQRQTSKHVHTLNKAGLVVVQPYAQQRIYALNPEPFMQLDDWINSFEQHWNTRFNKLDEYLTDLKKGK